MNDAVKVMVVDDTIDQPVSNMEVTATGHRYTETAGEKQKTNINNNKVTRSGATTIYF